MEWPCASKHESGGSPSACKQRESVASACRRPAVHPAAVAAAAAVWHHSIRMRHGARMAERVVSFTNTRVQGHDTWRGTQRIKHNCKRVRGTVLSFAHVPTCQFGVLASPSSSAKCDAADRESPPRPPLTYRQKPACVAAPSANATAGDFFVGGSVLLSFWAVWFRGQVPRGVRCGGWRWWWWAGAHTSHRKCATGTHLLPPLAPRLSFARPGATVGLARLSTIASVMNH